MNGKRQIYLDEQRGKELRAIADGKCKPGETSRTGVALVREGLASKVADMLRVTASGKLVLQLWTQNGADLSKRKYADKQKEASTEPEDPAAEGIPAEAV